MRADRLVSIILILQSRGSLTCAALAEELEVSRRTILRDLSSLSMAGVPVMAEGGHGGGVRLDESYRAGLTGLGEGELRALLVSTDGALAADLGMGEAFRLGRLKLQAARAKRFEPSLEILLIEPSSLAKAVAARARATLAALGKRARASACHLECDSLTAITSAQPEPHLRPK